MLNKKQKKEELFNQGLKKCPKCSKPKPTSDFNIDNRAKDGLQVYCKEHLCEYRNKSENKETINKWKKEFHKKFPWKRILNNIKNRCENSKHNKYKYYGGRGIKNYLNEEEAKELWFRDKAYNMKKPSIDRKENDGNYEFDNCEFIEKSENSVKDKRKSIIQFDLNMNFIREWNSTMEIERELGIQHSNISACCLGKYKQACGFKWRYVDEIKSE